jgi:hypothetical protein
MPQSTGAGCSASYSQLHAHANAWDTADMQLANLTSGQPHGERAAERNVSMMTLAVSHKLDRTVGAGIGLGWQPFQCWLGVATHTALRVSHAMKCHLQL